jgi:hypothetical protein
LGVKEKGSRFCVEGIDNDKELSHKFGQKLRAIPTINPSLPKIISIPNSPKVLAVFHIPFSEEGPHVPRDEQRMIFWKRTNKGKEYMSYEEIRMAFQRVPFEERKKHSLYLNEIFKKLSVISYATEHINKTLSFQVPNNYQNYWANVFLGSFIKKREELPSYYWIDIKDLDHLENTLSHLEHYEYADKFQLWLDLNRLVSEYNQIVKDAGHTLVRAIRKHMSQAFPSFTEGINESQQFQFPYIYYIRNIFEFIFEGRSYLIVEGNRPEFDKLELTSNSETNNFEIAFKESHYLGDGLRGINKRTFVQASSKDKLQVSRMSRTLNSICDESDVKKSFSNLEEKIKEIDDVRSKFRKQLEPLTKDIDAGYVIKGSCSFGY